MKIKFTGKIGQIKLDDYQLALGYKTSKSFLRIRYVFFSIAFSLFIIYVFHKIISSENQAFVFLVLGITSLIFGLIFEALNAIQRNKKIKLNLNVNGQISEEGITTWDSDTENVIKWTFFSGYRTNEDLLILISKMHHQKIALERTKQPRLFYKRESIMRLYDF